MDIDGRLTPLRRPWSPAPAAHTFPRDLPHPANASGQELLDSIWVAVYWCRLLRIASSGHLEGVRESGMAMENMAETRSINQQHLRPPLGEGKQNRTVGMRLLRNSHIITLVTCQLCDAHVHVR